jgi:hypothetical protein
MITIMTDRINGANQVWVVVILAELVVVVVMEH